MTVLSVLTLHMIWGISGEVTLILMMSHRLDHVMEHPLADLYMSFLRRPQLCSHDLYWFCVGGISVGVSSPVQPQCGCFLALMCVLYCCELKYGYSGHDEDTSLLGTFPISLISQEVQQQMEIFIPSEEKQIMLNKEVFLRLTQDLQSWLCFLLC